MQVHIIQHVPFEGPGAISDWISHRGYREVLVRPFLGEPIPRIDDIESLVVLGGPMSAGDDDSCHWLPQTRSVLKQATHHGRPVLGICLGAQLLGLAHGGRILPSPEKEIGWFPVERVVDEEDPFATVFPRSFTAFHWHGEMVTIPSGGRRLVKSAACVNQAFTLGLRAVGLQFHLEVTWEGAKKLIAACENELDGGPFVQHRDEMLSERKRFSDARAILFGLLDELHSTK